MGNPRVAAWKEGKSIRPLSSLGPSQVLEMNKKLCILLLHVSIERCARCVCKPVSVRLYVQGTRYLREILLCNMALEYIMWLIQLIVKNGEKRHEHLLLNKKQRRKQDPFVRRLRRDIFTWAEGYEWTSYRFCNLWTPDSIDPTHQPETGSLNSWLRELAKRALGLDALKWIFNCHQPSEAEVGNQLLGVLEGVPFFF